MKVYGWPVGKRKRVSITDYRKHAFPWGHVKPCPTTCRCKRSSAQGKRRLACLACPGAVDAETTLAFLEGIKEWPAPKYADRFQVLHSLTHSFIHRLVLHSENAESAPSGAKTW